MLKDYLKYLKNFPDLPGVYIMKDVDGEIIYVGKAIRLKSRILNYFQGSDDRTQISSLLEKLTDIDFVVTADERQALFLEADLIRRNQPRYNVKLKDGKEPLMIRLDIESKWPRLHLVRKKMNDGARYFGPYPFSYEARTLLEIIERTIPLRNCTDKVLKNRVRPCLQYQINRCGGPCCLPVDENQYQEWVDQAISLLEGNAKEVIQSLTFSMQHASEELRFEDATVIRDRLKVLKKITTDKIKVTYGNKNIDAFGIYREGSLVEVSILKTFEGRLYNSFSFGFEDVFLDDSDVLRSALEQFYLGSHNTVTNEIVVPGDFTDLDILAEIIHERQKRRVEIVVPKQGVKARLLEFANINAKENFEARFGSKAKLDRILKALKETFGLEQYPRTIECVDISHFQGKATVGAVVCFRDGKPDHSRYRYFHLSQEGKPDDFASMNEVVKKHLIRTNEEGTTADLMVIDGGPPQLVQALNVRKDLGVHFPALISIAKKRDINFAKRLPRSPRGESSQKKPERVYVEENPIPIILPPNNEVIQLLERIRDETHRAAITFHRKTRSKMQFESPLDKVRGLGPKKRLFLLKTFGSLDLILKQSVRSLVEEGKVSERIALEIKKIDKKTKD